MPNVFSCCKMADFNNFIIFFKDSVKTAFNSLMLHKLRTFLSLLGIVCGVTAVLAIIAIGEGAKLTALKQIERMGVTNIFIRAVDLSADKLAQSSQLHSTGLNHSDLVRINRGCSVVIQTAASKDLTINLAAPPPQLNPKVIGCSANYGDILQLRVASGRFLADLDNQRKNLVCVLGWQVSEALGASGKVGQWLRMGDKLWEVVGILERHDVVSSETAKLSLHNINEMIFLPLAAISSGSEGPSTPFGNDFPQETGFFSELIVEVDHQENVLAADSTVDRIMEVSHHGVKDYQIVIPVQLLAQSMKLQRVFNIVFGAVGAISLLVGGIGIMNIMLAGVSERTGEIGLRIAVGATELHIIIQFLVEAVLVTVGGGIIGVFAGIASASLIATFAGWPISITMKAVLVPLIVSVTIGLFSGLYPAIQAARLDPIKALGSFR